MRAGHHQEQLKMYEEASKNSQAISAQPAESEKTKKATKSPMWSGWKWPQKTRVQSIRGVET